MPSFRVLNTRLFLSPDVLGYVRDGNVVWCGIIVFIFSSERVLASTSTSRLFLRSLSPVPVIITVSVWYYCFLFKAWSSPVCRCRLVNVALKPSVLRHPLTRKTKILNVRQNLVATYLERFMSLWWHLKWFVTCTESNWFSFRVLPHYV